MRSGVRVGGTPVAVGEQGMMAPLVRRRMVHSGLLATGLAPTFSGFLIQLHYHVGQATSAVWGCGYAVWGLIHQLASLRFLVAVAWHLARNWQPLSLCRRRAAGRPPGFFVVVLFLPAAAAAPLAWLAFMRFGFCAFVWQRRVDSRRHAVPVMSAPLWHFDQSTGGRPTLA